MSTTLPLFPLGSVLFPGMTMALHVFEDRYLTLVNDLLSLPADQPRRFGVVGITLGHEVGEKAAHQWADVGCTAEISTVQRRPNSSVDLVVTGVERFRAVEWLAPDGTTPYLRAQTVPLAEEVGEEAEVWRERAAHHFAVYLERLDRIGIIVADDTDLPKDPVAASYALADASCWICRTSRRCWRPTPRRSGWPAPWSCSGEKTGCFLRCGCFLRGASRTR